MEGHVKQRETIIRKNFNGECFGGTRFDLTYIVKVVGA